MNIPGYYCLFVMKFDATAYPPIRVRLRLNNVIISHRYCFLPGNWLLKKEEWAPPDVEYCLQELTFEEALYLESSDPSKQ